MAAHNQIGSYGEALIARKLATIAPVQPAQRADLRWLGIEIEVKTARMSFSDRDRRAGIYNFCLSKPGHTTHEHADVVILVLAETGMAYIIPTADLVGRRKLRLSPRQSKYDIYRDAWEVLIDFIREDELQ